ncbi:trehalase [Oncorhynchus mykiss]|uniref:Trehalase n=1 Tax=Oncorhynchus mykiss TaxID=8022 RepID=A0A8K9XRB4_ONCMY|nr:trehalase [Oncorhynchus mykiss]
MRGFLAAVMCLCLCLVLFLCPLYSCALPPPCDSEIYCYGDILRQVQTAKLFDDDKHFVDMKLKSAPDIILTAFHNLTHGDPNSVPPAVLRDFLHKYFDEPGKEFAPWSPPDWHDNPQFLAGIADAELRSWAEKLHHLWKSLGRKISSDALAHPEQYSQIFTPHPFVVPGGRFRELYYWDSYWVINGLLLSEMTDTARGMILNFIHLINRYGFIPNGARVYYERRSQPPFLSLMVESYYQTTNDTDFLRTALPALEQEYLFWMRNRSVAVEVKGNKHVLNRFDVQVGLPRPESYSDDLELAEGLTEDAAERLWKELHSGAESGWDFSSRWFVDGLGNNNGSLKDTRTSLLIPTDLNALLCRNERTLAHFYRTLGNESEAARYDKAVSARQEAIEAVLWDEKRGVWLDYSLVTNTSHPAFYPTNLAPVWADCYSHPSMGQKALHYLQTSGGLAFPNGVPTSLVDSGQQWDYPNAWPPLQHILIQGLSSLPSQEARELGFDLAQSWIRTNWLAYVKYEAMFEKYNVNGDGKPGGGGEYEVQLGFGWTNGVALQLLSQYGDRLTSGSNGNSFTSCLSISVSVALLCSAQTLFL